MKGIVFLSMMLLLLGCAAPSKPCEQPQTYYNSKNADLWPHCEG